MGKYTTYLVADEDNRRDYKDRQLFANQKGADVYVEFHFNAKEYDKPGTDDNPAMVLVCDNASQKSRDMAKDFSDAVAETYEFPNRGVVELKRYPDGSADRAYWNLYYTNMKAFLIEPFYVSDIEQANLALDPAHQKLLAELLFNVIKKHYPNGATIACSLGHKFKASNTYDRGALVRVGTKEDGSPKYHDTLAEADLAEGVMNAFRKLCAGEVVPDPEPEVEPGKDEALELIASGLEQAAKGVRLLQKGTAAKKGRGFLWFRRSR